MELLNVYECPQHDQDFNHPDCPICVNINKRLEENKKARENLPKNRVKLKMEVYWPREKGNGGGGRVIENLGHRPIHFPTKEKYRNHLKQHGISEAR